MFAPSKSFLKGGWVVFKKGKVFSTYQNLFSTGEKETKQYNNTFYIRNSFLHFGFPKSFFFKKGKVFPTNKNLFQKEKKKHPIEHYFLYPQLVLSVWCAEAFRTLKSVLCASVPSLFLPLCFLRVFVSRLLLFVVSIPLASVFSFFHFLKQFCCSCWSCVWYPCGATAARSKL